MTSKPELVLHVWPSRWDLPTFTPECLASILHLQLAIPGEFVLEESTNPDLSPNGQLPYLTHGEACIASYLSIDKYVSGLHKPAVEGYDEDDTEVQSPSRSDLSAHLSRLQKSQQIAWMEYVSSNLGDLVACSFFTLRHNYYESSRRALAELFPVPQRYYLPDRLRETYRSRLEAAGLWSISSEEAEEEKREKRAQKVTSLAQDSVIQEAFGREKVLDKARTSLDLLNSLLGTKHFFFGERIAPIDVFVAAHILLLTEPQLPNTLLRDLIIGSYPALHRHAKFLLSFCLPTSSTSEVTVTQPLSLSSSFDVIEEHNELPRSSSARLPYSPVPLRLRSPSPTPLSQLISPFPYSLFNRGSERRRRRVEKSQEEKEFDRMRWAWFGMSVLGVVVWMWHAGLRVEFKSLAEEDVDGEGEWEEDGVSEEQDEDDEEIAAEAEE